MSTGEIKRLQLIDGIVVTPASDTPLGPFSYLDLAEGAAPSTPSSNIVRVYVKPDGRMYWKDDAGTEYAVADTLGTLTNPMTTAADLIVGGASGIPTRLAKGTANQLLGMNAGATTQEYKTLAVGSSGTDFSVANAANSLTFNLPDASASARGAMTFAAQVIGGTKTFNDGIKPSSSSDALAFYKEGTFSPIIVGSGNSFTAVTYTTQEGQYTRIGNMVAFALRVTWSAASGGAGNLRVNGLPYTAGTSSTPATAVECNRIDFSTGMTVVTGRVVQGSTVIDLVESGDNATNANLTVAVATGGSFSKTLFIAGIYFI